MTKLSKTMARLAKLTSQNSHFATPDFNGNQTQQTKIRLILTVDGHLPESNSVKTNIVAKIDMVSLSFSEENYSAQSTG